jgi:cytidine deaminase
MPDQPSNPEDTKLLTLARSVRARTGAAEGACVRDLDGRTYAGATVELPSLRLSAVAVAVAMAASSAAAGLEAVAVLGEAEKASDADLAVIRDFAGSDVPLYVADPRGLVVSTATT